MTRFGRITPLRAPEGAAGGAADGGADNAAAAAGAAAAAAAQAAGAGAQAQAAAPWWQAPDYGPEEQEWLRARGLTEDDFTKVAPKLVKGHRLAEQRLGRGLDRILDKPAEGQSYADWARANAAALGLPEKEDGYAVKRPESWPKDAPWDGEFEADARKWAFENGVPPAAFQGIVDRYASRVLALEQAAAEGMARDQATMMAELQREYGAQTEAAMTRARQGAEVVAQKAGLTPDQIAELGQVLGAKTGNATAIRFMAAIGEMLGEDTGIGLGRGGPLTMTPAEARAQLAAFTAEGSDWAKASASGNAAKIAELKPRFEQLAKLAAR
jgi:hypothetical protein